MENLVSPNPSFWKNKKVFLTGHTGFKGAWASLWLHQMGAQVTGYSLAPITTPNLFEAAGIAKLVEHEIGDVRDGAKLTKALQNSQAEIVLHMAAQPLVRYSYREPMETFETNVMGTAYLLQAVRETPSVKAVVIVTTDKVYENQERAEGYQEYEPLGGHDPYSASKACAEIVTAAMRRSFFDRSAPQHHMAAVASARAGNVIGGGDWSEDRLVPDLIRSFAEGKKVKIRNPKSIRPWQHVLEPLSGYFVLAEKLSGHDKTSYARAWNFGPAEEETADVMTLVKELSAAWGPDNRWEIDEGTHLHEAHTLRLIIENSKRELGWKPQWALTKTLQNTASWYRDFYKNPAQARQLCLDQIAEFMKKENANGR